MSTNDPVSSKAVTDETPLDAPPEADDEQPPASEEDEAGSR